MFYNWYVFETGISKEDYLGSTLMIFVLFCDENGGGEVDIGWNIFELWCGYTWWITGIAESKKQIITRMRKTHRRIIEVSKYQWSEVYSKEEENIAIWQQVDSHWLTHSIFQLKGAEFDTVGTKVFLYVRRIGVEGKAYSCSEGNGYWAFK